MCKHRRRRRKFIATQEPGNAGAWTIVEIVRRPVMVVSDGYQAWRMIKEMAKEGRR